MFACILAVRMLCGLPGLRHDQCVTHFTDYALLVRRGAELTEGLPVGREWPRADLFRQLAQGITAPPCRLLIRKVRAHVAEKALDEGDEGGDGTRSEAPPSTDLTH